MQHVARAYTSSASTALLWCTTWWQLKRESCLQLDKILVEATSIVTEATKAAKLTGEESGVGDLEQMIKDVGEIRDGAIEGSKDEVDAYVTMLRNVHAGIGSVFVIISLTFVLAALSRVRATCCCAQQCCDQMLA